MIKQAALQILKLTGGFSLARSLSKQKLRILCYHGIALDDEHRFKPALFMSTERFHQRMQTIADQHYPVLSLGDALQRLDNHTLPDNAVVLTIDDGWVGTHRYALPILEQFGFPATIYITTYYANYGEPVFNLMVRYLFWKTRTTQLDLSSLDPQLSGDFDLTITTEREKAANLIITMGKHHYKAPQQTRLARRCASALGIDIEPLIKQRLLQLMTREEVRDADARGFDIQLHTHRHLPLSEAGIDVSREIRDNRRILQDWLPGKQFDQLCYPGGFHREGIWDTLREDEVAAATTCEGGLNTATTEKMALKRYLDEDDRPQLTFESDLCGMSAWLRR
ncbi:MAG TPA: hypothetical protein EYN15_00570 [Chromatiales bacterium]|nr:hypothetical protein [Chromatiales bacterium]